jgi:hypothetical protein
MTDDLVERLRHGPYTIGKITGEILELSQAAERIEAQDKLIEALRGYTRHSKGCAASLMVMKAHPYCDCGLTDLLASIKEPGA